MKHVWVWMALLWSNASAADTVTVNAFNINLKSPLISTVEAQQVGGRAQRMAASTLHLLIQNRSDVPETVSLEFGVGTGAPSLLPETAAHRCTNDWGFWTRPETPVSLSKGATQDVQVTFCALSSSKLGPLTGQLQARTPTGSLYTQALTVNPNAGKLRRWGGVFTMSR